MAKISASLPSLVERMAASRCATNCFDQILRSIGRPSVSAASPPPATTTGIRGCSLLIHLYSRPDFGAHRWRDRMIGTNGAGSRLHTVRTAARRWVGDGINVRARELSA